MTQSINELKSYTEYNVNAPTSVFTIGFEYKYNVDGINVYVDGVEATTAGYTVQHDSQGTVTLTPAVPSGVVRLARETDIDTSAHTFSAGAKFTAVNMDENFQQIRHAQQEVNANFSTLEANTSVRLDVFSDRVDALNTEFLTTQDVVSDLVTISADTVSTANTALNTANAIDAKATDALDNSSNAVLDAAAALSTANAIAATATQALTDSTTALSSATTALNTANAVDTKATQALADAAAALTAASGALKSSNNLSDVVSATTARANLGVMSSSEVTTAIANATPTIPTATETVAGKAKIATTAIAQAGVNDTDFITAKKLRDALNASGDAPISACRAWVIFTCVNNVVTILNSMNILSVTRLGVANFKITYATPMPTANNVPLASGSSVVNINNTYAVPPSIRDVRATSCEVYHISPTTDFPLVTLGVFC